MPSQLCPLISDMHLTARTGRPASAGVPVPVRDRGGAHISFTLSNNDSGVRPGWDSYSITRSRPSRAGGGGATPVAFCVRPVSRAGDYPSPRVRRVRILATTESSTRGRRIALDSRKIFSLFRFTRFGGHPLRTTSLPPAVLSSPLLSAAEMGPDLRGDATAGPSRDSVDGKGMRAGQLKRSLSVSGGMSFKRERLSLDAGEGSDGPVLEAPGSPGAHRDRFAQISSGSLTSGSSDSRRSSTGAPGMAPPGPQRGIGSLTRPLPHPQSPTGGNRAARSARARCSGTGSSIGRLLCACRSTRR